MPRVAYIANEFPSPVEWYVMEEIRELRKRGALVIPCSARRAEFSKPSTELRDFATETLSLSPIRWEKALVAIWLCLSNLHQVAGLILEILLDRRESPWRRCKTLLHTAIGAYYAAMIRDFDVGHIHVHHGYFSSWIALVAARLLGISFSMTLHGSDLLLHPAHMNTKLRNCKFCLTVSEFNRQHIVTYYPAVPATRILVQRIGIETAQEERSAIRATCNHAPKLLAVGRLHAVKNHAFLLKACSRLRDRGIQFRCSIVGEGPERQSLELLIHELKLGDWVTLVGHVNREHVHEHYEKADLVVLTSQSEGIPLVLMEAMARGKPVLAPAITGIPELVVDGKTGFLYSPGSLQEFVSKVEEILNSRDRLEIVKEAAREHVRLHFEQRKNLEQFADLFLERITQSHRMCSDENLVLQQI